MVGGIRDVVLFGEWKLLLGFIAIPGKCTYWKYDSWIFQPLDLQVSRFYTQTVSGMHLEWRLLDLAVFFLGLSSSSAWFWQVEGNTDSAITVFGLMAGAAVTHTSDLLLLARPYCKWKNRCNHRFCGSDCDCNCEFCEEERSVKRKGAHLTL